MIDNDSPLPRHAQAEVPASDPYDKARDPGMKLSALNLKPGDKIRPVSDASGKAIKDGKVWVFYRADSEDQFFGFDPFFPDREVLPLAFSYGWEVVERAEKPVEEYKKDPIISALAKSAQDDAAERKRLTAERIVAAAVQIEGVTISLPRPARHGTILACTSYSLNMEPGRELQGFLTSTGRFVNRIQARHIADIAGQKPGRSGGRDNPELFSEDLW